MKIKKNNNNETTYSIILRVFIGDVRNISMSPRRVEFTVTTACTCSK